MASPPRPTENDRPGLELPSPVIHRGTSAKYQALAPTADRTMLETAKWMPDDEVEKCCNCGTPFTLFNRRHHCRKCGKIFDDKCSTKTLMLVAVGSKSAVRSRVCDSCYEIFYPKRPPFYTISHLPTEPLSNIFSFLDLKSAMRCMIVCKRWHEVVGSTSVIGRLVGPRFPYFELWPHFEWGKWLHTQERQTQTSSGKTKSKESRPAPYEDPIFGNWFNNLVTLTEQRERWLKGDTRKVAVDNGAFVRSLSVSGEAAAVSDNTGMVSLWQVPTGTLIQKFHHLGPANQYVKIDVANVRLYEDMLISASSRGVVLHRTAAAGAPLDAPPVVLLNTPMSHIAVDATRLYAAPLPADSHSVLHLVDLATNTRSQVNELPEIHAIHRFVDSPPVLLLGGVGAVYSVDTRDVASRTLVKVFESSMPTRIRITTLTAPEGTVWHPAATAYCVHREDLLQFDLRNGVSASTETSEKGSAIPPAEVRLHGVQLSPFSPALYVDQVKICVCTDSLELAVYEVTKPGSSMSTTVDKPRWTSRGRVGQRRMVDGSAMGLVAVSQGHLHFLTLKDL